MNYSNGFFILEGIMQMDFSSMKELCKWIVHP
jgi:hypothetical protein